MINCGIDIGTNTIRILIAQVEKGKIAKVLYSNSVITRLGADLLHTKMLSAAGMESTLTLFKEFMENIKKFSAQRVIAAATSAVREAENSSDFLSKAKEIGIDIQIISGKEEAYYTFLGVKACKNDFSDMLIFDIGGGSTEITLVKNNAITYTNSFDFGVVKLTELFGFGKPSGDAVHKKCAEYIQEQFAPLNDVLNECNGVPVVGTAGTVTTTAAIDIGDPFYDPEKINQHVLTYPRLDEMLNKIAVMSTEEKLSLPNVKKGREDLIVPGIIVVEELLKILGADKTYVSDYGLREGLTIAP